MRQRPTWGSARSGNMSGDTASSIKRRRVDGGQDNKGRESMRSEISGVYTSYTKLLAALDGSQTPSLSAFQSLMAAGKGEHTRSGSHSSSPRLLSKSSLSPPLCPHAPRLQTGNSPMPMRRMAARLVPRFIYLFSELIDEAVAMLIGLHQARHRTFGQDLDAMLVASRSDAMRGLGPCMEAAAAKLEPNRAIPVAKQIVDFLLRSGRAPSRILGSSAATQCYAILS